MLSLISKIFGGSKSEKDVKLILPMVEKTNRFFDEYQSLSNDQLRNNTLLFKERIRQHLAEIDETIAAKKLQAEGLPVVDINGRDNIYKEVDILKKERDEKIEEILKEILPEAFATVKETSRRFKDTDVLVSTATELDKEFATKKDSVTIVGDQSHFKNTWSAAGGSVTWNMVHYDVQLIGGAVLHSGKIS
ncbi:MAG: preprotein translocase subunit SecA, partial [Ferruginibacter sp.]|nr:preprotein translocase subunit SecA [Ferruginibacter sp.]